MPSAPATHMLFDTPVYFLFLAIVVALYWRLSWRRQNILLVIASYFFYGWWDWRFLGLIVISTLTDFGCARVIARSNDGLQRKFLAAASISVNLGFLGFFKYFNFFADSAHIALGRLGLDVPPRVLDIILPPGISFYTFQALAYIVDVYKRRIEPADSLIDYALFISLFPHLIAGPIQRPSHLLPQVQKRRVANSGMFFSGLQLICFGLLRKCVVADNCGIIANAAFNGQLGRPNVVVVALGAYAFAWQIYGDFSGYSDIARGSAQLLGFHFMVNFRQPYLARSLQEFWRRWHISLSTWLRDYLYIPLGGSRGSAVKTYRNILLTMGLGGLWHGANWTFVIWGIVHGIGLCCERLLQLLGIGLFSRGADGTELGRPAAWIRRIICFHVVCAAWIFFRAQSVGQAVDFISGLSKWQWRGEYMAACIFLALFVTPLMTLDLLLEVRSEEYLLERADWRVRAAAATCAGVCLLLFTANQTSAFIYFQF